MLSEHYGSDLILDIWLRTADEAGYGPFDDAFAARGTTFTAELRRFALAVLLRDFQDGSSFDVARLQDTISAPGQLSPADGVQRYAMDYIGLELGSGTYSVTLDSEDAGVEGIVVGVRGTSADIYPAGRATTVDFGSYDHAYLAVINQTRPPNEAGCATARYTITVADPQQGGTNMPASRMTVPNFTPPRVEAVTDPAQVPFHNPFAQTQYDINQEIQQVDVPFTPITPRGAPDGYELDSVYGVNADELGADFVALNAPSGGTVVQMLYYNTAGQVIRITESPAIYLTVGEWMAANRLEFKPGVQVWTAGTVDTAVVDQSGGSGGPYLVAFVVRERFMVIDGDADLSAMLDMAARFASSFGAELPSPRGF